MDKLSNASNTASTPSQPSPWVHYSSLSNPAPPPPGAVPLPPPVAPDCPPSVRRVSLALEVDWQRRNSTASNVSQQPALGPADVTFPSTPSKSSDSPVEELADVGKQLALGLYNKYGQDSGGILHLSEPALRQLMIDLLGAHFKGLHQHSAELFSLLLNEGGTDVEGDFAFADFHKWCCQGEVEVFTNKSRYQHACKILKIFKMFADESNRISKRSFRHLCEALNVENTSGDKHLPTIKKYYNAIAGNQMFITFPLFLRYFDHLSDSDLDLMYEIGSSQPQHDPTEPESPKYFESFGDRSASFYVELTPSVPL
eukprot:gene2552-528_t